MFKLIEVPSTELPCNRTWNSVIDGQLSGGSGASFVVTEPSTGTALAEVTEADGPTVDRAIRSSRDALEEWRNRPARERAALLGKIADAIARHADELSVLETLEIGKPYKIAQEDVTACIGSFVQYSGLADMLRGELRAHGAIESRVVYEPYGVVASILPFNWPPIHFGRTVAPALLGGNTVIVKPGEQAPLAALRLVEIANTVLPPGVLNAVAGIEAGAALSNSSNVRRICFTGSTATGRKVLNAAARNITFTTLELGGKNPLIIFDDADMDLAVRVAIEGMFYNQGQACSSTARILVHDSIFHEFSKRFSAFAETLVVGPGLDPASEIGPMVDNTHQERILHFIDVAISEGATVVGQGEIPSDENLRGGFWVAPTVLHGVTADSTCGQEEIFGPVAALMPFETDDQAVEIANGTQYGLTSAVVTTDERRALSVADRLEAGTVYINNYFRRGAPGTPSGGVKGSGYGRDNGVSTIFEFVHTKSIRLPSGYAEIPSWPNRS